MILNTAAKHHKSLGIAAIQGIANEYWEGPGTYLFNYTKDEQSRGEFNHRFARIETKHDFEGSLLVWGHVSYPLLAVTRFELDEEARDLIESAWEGIGIYRFVISKGGKRRYEFHESFEMPWWARKKVVHYLSTSPKGYANEPRFIGSVLDDGPMLSHMYFRTPTFGAHIAGILLDGFVVESIKRIEPSYIGEFTFYDDRDFHNQAWLCIDRTPDTATFRWADGSIHHYTLQNIRDHCNEQRFDYKEWSLAIDGFKPIPPDEIAAEMFPEWAKYIHENFVR